mgnify:CR=1 FL=1
MYCYGESFCEVQGYTYQGPVNAYNVNWDTDEADCICKVGDGRWNIPFDPGTSPSCCGDDPAEFYAGPSNAKSCDGTEVCCNTSTYWAFQSRCVEACPVINRVYWTNLKGDEVNITDAGDYVKMVAETSYAEGQKVNFTVWEAGTTSCYEEYYSDYSQNNKAYVLWQVKKCPDDTTDGNKFKAFFPWAEAAYVESDLLSVNTQESNSPPLAIILEPKNGDIFQLGENINFISGSYDEDDPIISYLWDFGDGTTGSQANETHSYIGYNLRGPKTITLTIQDARGLVSTAKVSILINSSDNDPPVAIISEPSYGEIFSNLLITFNATESVDDETPFDQLIFRWDFDDGISYENTGIEGAFFTRLFSFAGEHTVRLTVQDSEGLSSQVETIFTIRGCKIPLDGEYEFVPLESCSVQTKHYYCVNETLYYDTLVEHCEGSDGIAGTLDDCCPRGYYCPDVGAACIERETTCSDYSTQTECEEVGCIWLDTECTEPAGMLSCSDYPTETTCNNDILGLGKAGGTGLGTEICGKTFGDYIVNASSCRCEWESNETGCKFVYNVNKIIGGDEFITCLKNFSITDCIGGKQVLAWSAKILPVELENNETAQEQCSTGEKAVKCGIPVSKLDFFDIINFIIGSLIIFAYYLFLFKGKKSVSYTHLTLPTKA